MNNKVKKPKYQSITYVEFNTSATKELEEKFPGTVFIVSKNGFEYFIVPKHEQSTFNEDDLLEQK